MGGCSDPQKRVNLPGPFLLQTAMVLDMEKNIHKDEMASCRFCFSANKRRGAKLFQQDLTTLSQSGERPWRARDSGRKGASNVYSQKDLDPKSGTTVL